MAASLLFEEQISEYLKRIRLACRAAANRRSISVPKPKPAPDGLLEVCKDLGLSPSDCVYIGDSPSDGVAAKAAGMPAIAVLWGSHGEENLRAAPFDHYCYTIEELKSVLPNIE